MSKAPRNPRFKTARQLGNLTHIATRVSFYCDPIEKGKPPVWIIRIQSPKTGLWLEIQPQHIKQSVQLYQDILHKWQTRPSGFKGAHSRFNPAFFVFDETVPFFVGLTIPEITLFFEDWKEQMAEFKKQRELDYYPAGKN